MRERPIIFNGEMVRAILEGRKTQTRRVIQWSNRAHDADGPKLLETSKGGWWPYNCYDNNEIPINSPYGGPGDKLYVREKLGLWNDDGFLKTSIKGLDELPPEYRLAYASDHKDPANGDGPHKPYWRPSIHMPRWASRIDLEVKAVRVERVKDIGLGDILKEGVDGEHREGIAASAPQLRSRFRILWDSINDKRGYGWDANPWVWVVEFERLAR